ncbi:MAG TPA: NlpC/P60 family protein [Frankiaceae bacterium]|nr:NlpC/P60 family protein [Frankiaceae bacterium]
MRIGIAARAAGVVAAIAALGAVSAVAVPGSAAPKAPDQAAAKVLAAAKDQVGDKYQWGGNGPDRWDCSGLTSVLWRTVGGVSSIPRVSRDQQAWAWPVSKDAALPGDLVFFGNPVHHVGIYEGDGRMIDASSSKGMIVERALWTSDVVRFGRVPRPGVARPAPPKPAKAPAPKPTAQPAPKATPKPAPAKPTKPAPAPKQAAAPKLNPIPPAGHQPRTKTTPQMAAFVTRAGYGVGSGWERYGTGPRFDAAGLVRKAWLKVGYGTLPRTAAEIERLAKPVALKDLAVGDLILYGAPAVHVAVYVGNGEMIDASKVLQKVTRRRVFASETVRFARLTPPKR